ncbi:hypothetical protein SNEBB_005438 [Seison nebaliae]|nr:hypothetical protein SNEBB_005438 [Seison nebaliae]
MKGVFCAGCCTVISIWGIIMLSLLGVFFKIHAVTLAEELPLPEENVTKAMMDHAYDKTAYNCWIAAGLYIPVLIISITKLKLAMRKTNTNI